MTRPRRNTETLDAVLRHPAGRGNCCGRCRRETMSPNKSSHAMPTRRQHAPLGPARQSAQQQRNAKQFANNGSQCAMPTLFRSAREHPAEVNSGNDAHTTSACADLCAAKRTLLARLAAIKRTHADAAARSS